MCEKERVGREGAHRDASGVHPPAHPPGPPARPSTPPHPPSTDSPRLLSQKIEAGVDKAIGAASAWNRTILVDATLHTSKLNPCKTGYMADAAGKCTVCDFTLSMVPGCNACVDPGTCSGCGEGYTFVAADASPDTLVSGTCICDVAHLNDPKCVQCTIAGSCDQCLDGECAKREVERGNAWERLTPNTSPLPALSRTLTSSSTLWLPPHRLLPGTGVQGLHGVRRQLPDLRERDDLQPVRRGKYGRDSKGVGGVGGALVSCNAACAFAHAPLIA